MISGWCGGCNGLLSADSGAFVPPVATGARAGLFAAWPSAGTPSKNTVSHFRWVVELQPATSRTPQRIAIEAGRNRRLFFTHVILRFTVVVLVEILFLKVHLLWPKPKTLTFIGPNWFSTITRCSSWKLGAAYFWNNATSS